MRSVLTIVAVASSTLLTLAALSACVVTPSGSVRRSPAQIAKDAEAICRSDPLVGQESGVRATIAARKKDLDDVQASLDATVVKKLSQELDGYSVEWEVLSLRYFSACKSYESCKLRAQLWNGADPASACANERADYGAERTAGNRLMGKLIELRRAIPASKS